LAANKRSRTSWPNPNPFVFRLAAETEADAYELERRLGYHSQRYTNPPEDVAGGYAERF